MIKIINPKTIITLMLLSIFIELQGCATADKISEITITPESTVIIAPPNFEQAGGVEHASKFALMALFAKTAYRKDIANDKNRNDSACEYLAQPEHRDVMLDMPRNKYGGGWQRWTNIGSCYNEGGLFFETYVHVDEKHNIDKAVIGIRGTENSSLFEARHDWGANLSGAIPFTGAEYERARRYMLPVINQLALIKDINNNPIEIYLTGHSLGGGIAQYMAYISPNVKAAYTFNTSPVTHWFQLSDEEKVRDPKIYRIYMNKEVLSIVREITSRFNIRRYNRFDYEFFYVNAKAIEAHSIDHLTCQFAARVPKCGAEYDYSYANASEVLDNPNLCSNEIRSYIPPIFLYNR